MDYDISMKVVNLLTAILVGFMILLPVMHEYKNYKDNLRDELEVTIENDYAAYLDGNEVDISKLDTYNYVVTVDSESKSIYLTEKGFWDWGQVIKVK